MAADTWAMEAKVIRLRYPGICLRCAAALSPGVEAWWDPQRQTVTCHPCAGGQPQDPVTVPRIATSNPSASAQQEYERLNARHEARIRKKHPLLRCLILAATDEPNSISAWSKGAVGERKLGAMLDGIPGVRVPHDRRIPGSRANLDHLVVSPSGVWVIDSKAYKGRIERKRSRLFVGGWDRSNLVQGVRNQTDVVRRMLVGSGMGVRRALCFIDGDWPLLSAPFTVDRVAVHYRKSLRRALQRSGPVHGQLRTDVAGLLNAKSPPAVQ